ncbi:MAG: hypothetical protein MJK04_16210 [Psychrosphaera sp.]|nr:hypothetical protein [Psychrosphaera sp.]
MKARMSESVAKARAKSMRRMTKALNDDGDNRTSLSDKARYAVQSRRAQQRLPPYQCDSELVWSLVSKIKGMKVAVDYLSLKTLTIQYLCMLPDDPFEAVYLNYLAIIAYHSQLSEAALTGNTTD